MPATLGLSERSPRRFLELRNGKETPENTPISRFYTAWATSGPPTNSILMNNGNESTARSADASWATKQIRVRLIAAEIAGDPGR